MLPLISCAVWILAAPREYLPSAQEKSFRLREIVVESRASTSFSMSTFGIGWFSYNVTNWMRYVPKSANILQSLFSFARDRVNWLTCRLIPRWYSLFWCAYRQVQISRNELREVNWPKNKWRNWFQQLSPLVRWSPSYLETHFSNSYLLMNWSSWEKTYLPEFIELHLKTQNYRSNQIKKSKNAYIILLYCYLQNIIKS